MVSRNWGAGPGPTEVVDLPGALNGFFPGHRYRVVVTPIDNGYGTPFYSSATVTFTFGDVGRFGQDCYMNVTPPYLSGGNIVFSASTSCPRSSGTVPWSNFNADYIRDNTFRAFPGGGFAGCWTVTCSITRQVPASSGTHKYCFDDLYAIFGDNAIKIYTVLRITGLIHNSNMCSTITY